MANPNLSTWVSLWASLRTTDLGVQVQSPWPCIRPLHFDSYSVFIFSGWTVHNLWVIQLHLTPDPISPVPPCLVPLFSLLLLSERLFPALLIWETPGLKLQVSNIISLMLFPKPLGWVNPCSLCVFSELVLWPLGLSLLFIHVPISRSRQEKNHVWCISVTPAPNIGPGTG